VIGRVLWIFIGAIGINFLTTGIAGVFNLIL
jgi:small neutral amino acid transporter SnatA (MarC family)